jgi:hypothetical protein
MLNHLYSKEFKKAANKEINDLLAKGTFEYIDLLELDNTQKDTPLPLMWVFTYKFD